MIICLSRLQQESYLEVFLLLFFLLVAGAHLLAYESSMILQEYSLGLGVTAVVGVSRHENLESLGNFGGVAWQNFWVYVLRISVSIRNLTMNTEYALCTEHSVLNAR